MNHSEEKEMYDIDLRKVVFLTDASRERSFRRLGMAAVSSILSDRTFRALTLLHAYVNGHIDKLPDINNGDLVTLESLSYLHVSADKTVVTLS
jgi:hypothetical protein